MFSIKDERLKQTRKLLGGTPLAREKMRIITATKDGAVLGHSRFKIIDELQPSAARDLVMDTLLDETFGTAAVALVDDAGGCERRVAPLVSLFVEPAERRNRIGEALFRAMLREARRCGYDYALLTHQVACSRSGGR